MQWINSDAKAVNFLYSSGLEDITSETPEPDPTMEFIIQDPDMLGSVNLPEKKMKKDELQGITFEFMHTLYFFKAVDMIKNTSITSEVCLIDKLILSNFPCVTFDHQYRA